METSQLFTEEECNCLRLCINKSPTSSAFIGDKDNSSHALEKCEGVRLCTFKSPTSSAFIGDKGNCCHALEKCEGEKKSLSHGLPDTIDTKMQYILELYFKMNGLSQLLGLKLLYEWKLVSMKTFPKNVYQIPTEEKVFDKINNLNIFLKAIIFLDSSHSSTLVVLEDVIKSICLGNIILFPYSWTFPYKIKTCNEDKENIEWIEIEFKKEMNF